MRYEKLIVDKRDWNLIVLNNEEEGNIDLIATEELIEITNTIREEKGYADLVSTKLDNDVYYNFYLCFNAQQKTVEIQATCNHGAEDDYASYELPMTQEEKVNIMYQLIGILSRTIYNS